MGEIYLDNSATTIVDKRVAQYIMDTMLECYGNPSSLYDKGLQSQLKFISAKKQIASMLGTTEDLIYMTSGGTEADNLAIFGAVSAKKRRGNKIITTAFEHSAVLAPFEELKKQGFEAVLISPDENGNISVESIVDEIDEKTIFLSVMLVNNEVGSIMPIADIVKAVRKKNKDIIIHCDAVQAFGKIPINVKALDVDLMSISGHKIHCPKGIGALYIKKGVRINPIIFGGSQQNKIRPGTESLPLTCGFGYGAELLSPHITENLSHANELNAYLRGRVHEIDGAIINSPSNALPYILNISVMGIRSETMLHFLEARGIYVSSASACTKGAKSHVLAAMKLSDKRIDSALRISFSRYNTKDNIDELIAALKDGTEKIARSK